MPKTKVAISTSMSVGMSIAMITAQCVTAAALAVTMGVFAVAFGMIAARGQNAQVRIAVALPAQPTSCVRGGTVTKVGEHIVDACEADPSRDVRACGEAVDLVLKNKPTCSSGCTLYRKTPMTATVLGCESWQGTAAWNQALSEPVLVAADGTEVDLGPTITANPYVTGCSASREWRCDVSQPAAVGEYSWVAW